MTVDPDEIQRAVGQGAMMAMDSTAVPGVLAALEDFIVSADKLFSTLDEVDAAMEAAQALAFVTSSLIGAWSQRQ